MGADSGENRSDDPCSGVKDAELIADINVDRSGGESRSGDPVNGICASVSDIKEAVGSIRENRVVWVTGDCEAVRSQQGEERFRLAGGAGVEINAIFWSAPPVRARTPVIVSFNESESMMVTDVGKWVARFVPVNVELRIGLICSGECRPVVSLTITASAPLAGFVSLMRTLP